MYRRTFIGMAAAAPLLAGTRPAFGGAAHVYSEHGVAIRGADAVAYHRGMGAVAGTVAERVQWRGAVWLFSTPQHREAFEYDPRHFAPRFGGYCAYTLSQGGLAAIDPRAFSIHEGRLYLVRSREIREVWLQNPARNIALAESHWPAALD